MSASPLPSPRESWLFAESLGSLKSFPRFSLGPLRKVSFRAAHDFTKGHLASHREQNSKRNTGEPAVVNQCTLFVYLVFCT